jgi:hypothetical protein
VLLRLRGLWRQSLDRKATSRRPLSLSLKVTPYLISPGRERSFARFAAPFGSLAPLNARSATPLGFLFNAAGVSKFSSP